MTILNELKLSFVEGKVLKDFSGLIEKEVPEAVQIIVFGSRARSVSDENSDFDIAIILNTPHIDKKLWERLWEMKWKVLEPLQAEELPLSLTLITQSDFISRDSGIEKTIKTEGIAVWKREN